MAESHKIQVSVPISIMAKIREWSDSLGMSASEFMLHSILLGAPLLLEKFGKKENEKSMKNNRD